MTGKSRIFFLFGLSLFHTLFFKICTGFFQPVIAGVRCLMKKEIPKLLVYQRVRNRIIELFELYVSREDQLKYQSKAPVNVFYELFEQWDDWVPEGDIRVHFSPPVFSEEELREIESFDKFIDNLFDQLPDSVENLNDFHQMSESDELAYKASQALSILSKRGRFSEDNIETRFTEQSAGRDSRDSRL